MSAAPLLAVALAVAPSLGIAPPATRPGDAVLVRVEGAREAPRGTIAGQPLEFWRAADGWRALGALPIETPPGPLVALVEADGVPLDAAVDIVEPGFPSRALTVAPRFVEPPPTVKRRIEADRRAFLAAYDRPFAPPAFRRGFAWPFRASLTGRFGDQRVFNGTTASVHYGVDIDGPRGAPVRASNDGAVVLARNAYLSGKSVVVSHGAGVYTIYFHMDRIDVRTGAKVRRGQRLGIIGSTGRSTGPHLHWSVRVAGLFVDPESLLAMDFASGTAPPRRAGSPSGEPSPPAPAAGSAPPPAALPTSARPEDVPAP
jgi:murein DD-endopeptidase MepM/ murein hydrolase activator NlpD